MSSKLNVLLSECKIVEEKSKKFHTISASRGTPLGWSIGRTGSRGFCFIVYPLKYEKS